MSQDDLRRAGFKDRTRIDEARERLLERVAPHDRTERVPLASADGRTLAAQVTAPNPVPGYDRAAMDGYAVRAEDTFGASDHSPNLLREGEAVGPERAVRVHTGSEIPPGADAVVMIEQVDELGDELEIRDAVAEGENVGPVGEDVSENQTLYEPGHCVRPSDLGLLKSVGLTEVDVRERPTVSVIPTGEELVQSDPDPGEVIETNALTISRLAHRWGGRPTYRDIVTDDHEALRAAIQRDLTKDLVVTTGGSSVGERDLIPEVVDDIGGVIVHGVALKPGHPVALGVIEHSSISSQNSPSSGNVVEDTPILMLPGYPVACIVNAVQFLRPALKRAGGMPIEDHPATDARLERKIRSEPGIRTFARVKLDRGDGSDDEATARPTRVSGSGVLSSVALADGWVVVPEDREGIAEGERVAVEDWEWSA